jgi:nucleotide-binding universal stress UspA family protein
VASQLHYLLAMSVKTQAIVIWAIDAFEPSHELIASAISVLRSFSFLGWRIQPVYVLTPNQLNLTSDFVEYASFSVALAYKPAAQKALQELLSHISLPGLMPGEVLALDSPSSQQSAEALSRFAQKLNARAIVTSSHARTGLGRFILGSFSETLLYKSEVPVLIVHPHLENHVTHSHSIQNIFFPTDFGPESESMFRAAVNLAKTFDAKLTLFHSVPHPIEPVLQSGVYLLGGGWMPIQNYLGNEVQKGKRRAEAWARWAFTQKKVKVETRIHVDGGSISDLILGIVKNESFDMIAMAAQSGPVSIALLGSITRKVVRHASCPVWVLRESASEHKRSKKIQAA